MKNMAAKVYYVHVTVYRGGRWGYKIESLKWRGLPFEVRHKWDWYFRLRAAMLQVEYPKDIVEITSGSYDPESDDEKKVAARRISNLIVAKKRKITEFKNKIELAEKNWVELFPIEDHIIYTKAKAKLKRLEKELCEYQLIEQELLKNNNE